MSAALDRNNASTSRVGPSPTCTLITFGGGPQVADKVPEVRILRDHRQAAGRLGRPAPPGPMLRTGPPRVPLRPGSSFASTGEPPRQVLVE